MGQGLDVGEIEKAGHPLDGVERPEDGVDQLLVQRVGFPLDDVDFDGVQMLAGLLDEPLHQLGVLVEFFPRGHAVGRSGHRRRRGRRSGRRLRRSGNRFRRHRVVAPVGGVVPELLQAFEVGPDPVQRLGRRPQLPGSRIEQKQLEATDLRQNHRVRDPVQQVDQILEILGIDGVHHHDFAGDAVQNTINVVRHQANLRDFNRSFAPKPRTDSKGIAILHEHMDSFYNNYRNVATQLFPQSGTTGAFPGGSEGDFGG